MFDPTRLCGLAAVALLVLASCSPQEKYTTDASVAETLESDRLDARISLEKFDTYRLNAAIFWATNEARAAEGLKPLEHHSVLEEEATKYAVRLVKLNALSHSDPETGASPQDRLTAAGVANPLPSENIATNVLIQMGDGQEVYEIDASRGLFSTEPRGKPIPFHTYTSLGRAFVKNWLDSPGHRRNLLDDEAVQLGCGVALDRSQQFPVVIGVQKFQRYESIVMK